jgi:hypothetical protein
VPLFHGTEGAWFAAPLTVAIVTVDDPVPPAVRVTGVAVAVTSATVPVVEATLVVKEMVPAKLVEVRLSAAVPLVPAFIVTPAEPPETL